MNFYKHHLGDYDGDTAHLSWDEDMAYTRLLRAYYRRERPIMKAEAYRLCRAQTKTQRLAVDAVLAEFFTLTNDGFHNKRADAEISSYQTQAETNRRIARQRTVKRNVQRTANEPLNETCNEPSTKGIPNHKPLAREEQKEAAVAASPPAVVDPLWGECLEVFTKSGTSVTSARSYVGKLLKDWDHDAVVDAIRESSGTADPKAYVRKLLAGKPRRTGGDAEYFAQFEGAT